MKQAKTKLAIFEGRKIRRHWDKKVEKWYFSVVDVVQALTNQLDFIKSRKYWNKLAERLRKEGSEVVTKCHRLKMLAEVSTTEISQKEKPDTFDKAWNYFPHKTFGSLSPTEKRLEYQKMQS